MATETRIILVCDGCGADSADGNGEVTAHRITIDGAGFTVDSCAACWGGSFKAALKPLTKHAARVRLPAKTRGRGKLRVAG